jgi:hypothetical protein
MFCDPEHMAPCICLSAGFTYDLPEHESVFVLPHMLGRPFEDGNQGEIVIPYRSIRFINRLAAGSATFRCFPDRGAAMDPTSNTKRSTGDGTR